MKKKSFVPTHEEQEIIARARLEREISRSNPSPSPVSKHLSKKMQDQVPTQAELDDMKRKRKTK